MSLKFSIEKGEDSRLLTPTGTYEAAAPVHCVYGECEKILLEGSKAIKPRGEGLEDFIYCSDACAMLDMLMNKLGPMQYIKVIVKHIPASNGEPSS